MSFNTYALTKLSGPAQRDLPKSYAEAAALSEWASKRRGKSRHKIGHNLFLIPIDDGTATGPIVVGTAYAIKLHRTHVVTFHSDDSVTLNTGGWQTRTTRSAMNRCGVRIGLSGGVADVTHGGADHTFRDGMRLHPDGTVTGPAVSGTPEEVRKRRRDNLRRFKREEAAYLKRRAAQKPSDPPPNPANGYPAIPFYWEGRSGGYAPRGNCPEAFP